VVGQQAQDVALDAEIVSDDVEPLARTTLRPLLQRPVGAFVPLERPLGGHDLGEVHALEAREAARSLDREGGACRRVARGALAAARWLAGRPAGLYSMMDVLGL